MQEQTNSTLALVLRSLDYGESDRIVTLLTEKFGKIGVIARGARRSRKRFLGTLEPFLLLEIEVRFGRGELAGLEQARVLRAFPRILTDLTKIEAAGRALKLVMVGTPLAQRDSRLFSTVVMLLQRLEEAQDGVEELALSSQVRVITLLGFAPCFDACGHCGKRPQGNRSAFFDPRSGHLVCQSCGGASVYLSGAARRRLIRASGPEWHELKTPWSPEQQKEATTAVTLFIKHHIDHGFCNGGLDAELSR